jgi:hypothetical protein
VKCSSCEKPIRKGSGRRALVLSRANKPTMGTVCTRCHASAVPVVVPPPTTCCGRQPARYCAGCYGAAAENVRHLSAANAGMRAAGVEGLGEGRAA